MGKTKEPTSIVNGVPLRVPESFEGILPVKSARDFAFEAHSFLGLKHSLRKGDAALDVGCSYGVMSALIGKLVGDSGKCHSLEANGDVIGMAELLLKDNGLAGAVKVHNAAVSDRSGEVEFYAVPGFSSVASTASPEIRKAHPDSAARKVGAVTIDGFCSENGISPRCIKIDVEGSECVALRGARRTVEQARPDLVIETHGAEILGVGGSLAELAAQLEAAGYRIVDMHAGEQVAAGEYARRYADALGTMLATARMSEADVERVCKDAREAGPPNLPERASQVSGDLDFTGERVVPGKTAASLYNEHLARYAFAAGMAEGKRVLDMGCGAGYGSALLSEAGAGYVLGIDSSQEAVEYARGRYGRDGVEFAVAQGSQFEAGAKFDVAVAFEVIEHTRDHAGFVDAAGRALKDGGALIISTPNREENPPGYSNPYHEKEMDEQEFRALLERRFACVHMLHQSPVFGVAILGKGSDGGRIGGALGPAEARKKYLIAVCSDAQRPAPRGVVFPTAFDHAEYFAQTSQSSDAAELRALVDTCEYEKAYEFSRRPGSGPQWDYLSAFAAHMTGRHAESIPLYGRALEGGFDEFWVRYNRGQAHLSAGDAGRAIRDLEAALAIDPAHADARKLLDGLRGRA